MRSTQFLIDALRNYGEALDAGAETTQEEINALDEALAALVVKVAARNGAYEAQAADGFLCVETTCPAVGTDHQYGDPECGYEIQIRTKEPSDPDDYDDRMPAESQIYPLDR